MAYFQSTSITDGAQHEAELHLYMHQNFSGPNANQKITLNPENRNKFGLMVVLDWTIREGRDPGSKIIARAQGTQAQCGQNLQRWHDCVNIVFEDDSFNGSTLMVRGWESSGAPREWAIVGGTGKFALAQGIISRTVVSEDDDTGRIIKLLIHVFYRTIKKSTVR